MSLDGALIRHLKNEFSLIKGNRVYKIYQPSGNEIILCFRGYEDNHKLLISCGTNSARVHFTDYSIENPQTPPMFCMLLRKKLPSAKLIEIRQDDLERALYFIFESKNEMGDTVNITLVSEIMGKYSNIILLSEDGKIIDAIRRVNSEMSSKRTILPGQKYMPPPPQNKSSILDLDINDITQKILSLDKNITLYKALSSVIKGISLTVCEDIVNLSELPPNIKICELSDDNLKRVKLGISEVSNIIRECSGSPYMIENSSGQPCDISFICSSNKTYKKFNSFSNLLDNYYREKDYCERILAKTSGLQKKINNIISRCERKISAQQKELIQCTDRDKYKIYGDLLTSNIYLIKKGDKSIKLKNFYSENYDEISIPLDPSLNGIGNAQKYYKKYKKASNAVTKLSEEIKKAKDDIEYLKNILDYLSRCESDAELIEIKQELYEQGYIKNIKNKKQIKIKPLGPLEFHSEDGLKIYVGRNSKQNEKLTFKIAKKDDIWFHVKDLPGTHTILVTKNNNPSEQSIVCTAKLCALHSKARNSSNVAVDYTEVKNVKRIPGGKPGMVNYVNYKTIYVTPDKSIIDKYKI